MSQRWWWFALELLVAVVVLSGLAVGLAAALVYPSLPSIETLTDYRPKIPLRVFTADGAVIGEFGEERRSVVRIQEVPKTMIQAILAAEDDRFYRHGGVDYLGVARAAIANLLKHGAREGASTITMQVARNFFLSPEKTFRRKFNEILLAFKIEHGLSKDQILELYINQIYLGQRAYGFAAAAQTYFGKSLDQLSVAETAMLAGLPKAPSRYNPVANPARAKMRQHYVLRRMRELGYIDEATYQQALEEKLAVRHEPVFYEVKADYVAEMARQMMYERYGEASYTEGLRVITTLRRADQEAANAAVRQGVLDYDRRHGYRGPEAHLALPADLTDDSLEEALQDFDDVNGLKPALVLKTSAKALTVFVKGVGSQVLTGEQIAFAQRALAPKASRPIVPGSVIRVDKNGKGAWQVSQLPEVEAAFVSLAPQDGAVRALVGGFDFSRNKFNHAIQAWRQPGSSFKPFVYSAALEKGFTPATLVDDGPIVLDPASTGGKPWEPKNFDGTYGGPTPMRVGLMKSRNLVSIRILQAIGTDYAQDYITRFGFDRERHPPYLTMALGAGSVTPFQMAMAYAVFANGGYRVKPYYVQRIEDGRGRVLAEASPVRAGQDAERVLDARNAFIMTSMMQDVVRRGTAARAMQLKRQDLAGKTGTTNDQVDAWFCGYNKAVVAVTWIGFDKPRSLGGNETGAHAALPIWMQYMGRVLKGVPEALPEPPEGVVVVKIDPTTGWRSPEGVPEYFYAEYVPPEAPPLSEGSDEVHGQTF